MSGVNERVAEQIAVLHRELQRRWPAFPLPREAAANYARDLAGMEAEAIGAAIAALSVDGVARLPTSGQIRRKVAELEMDAPAWGAARSSLIEWRRQRPRRSAVVEAWACPQGRCDGTAWIYDDDANEATDCACRPQFIAAMRGTGALPVLLREFVDERHIAPGEIDLLQEGGHTTLEAQLRKRWEEFIGRAISDRALAGLPATAGLERLEAARDEDERRPARRRRRVAGQERDALPSGGFDPLAALPAPAQGIEL